MQSATTAYLSKKPQIKPLAVHLRGFETFDATTGASTCRTEAIKEFLIQKMPGCLDILSF